MVEMKVMPANLDPSYVSQSQLFTVMVVPQ
jgi:hypothetical protein